MLISEVSGVDRPANLVEGWVVMKGADKATPFAVGPDSASWDVGAAEARVREFTKAIDGPNLAYASCFLWHDKTAADANEDGVPDSYGDYKFLVADVVDGKISVMPSAVRAAAERLPTCSLSDTEKTSVGSLITKMVTPATPEDAPSTLERIKGLLFPTRKDADDMTPDELKAALDERDTSLLEKVAEVVSKAATPVEVVPAVEPTVPVLVPAVDPAALTPEGVTKAIEDGIAAGLAPYNDILEKTLDRIEGIETTLGRAARKSLDGQEDGSEAVVKTAPNVTDAIHSALVRGKR